MADASKASSPRTLAVRYAPFLAIVALQLVLITMTPSSTKQTTTVAGNTTTGGAQTATDSASLEPGPVSGGTGGSAAASTGGTSQGATSPGAGAAGGGAAGAARSGTAAGAATGARTAAAATATAAGQQLDALGRLLGGDKAKCAPGGLLQENVTMHSPPCMPRFEGDNGGATSSGVTKDTIQIVLIYPN